MTEKLRATEVELREARLKIQQLEEQIKELEEERDGPHYCGLIDHGPYCECGEGFNQRG